MPPRSGRAPPRSGDQHRLHGLLAIPSGLLSERIGRRAVILGGLLIIAGSSFLLYLSTTPGKMIGLYFLFAIGLAAYSPSMMSYVADIVPSTHLWGPTGCAPSPPMSP
ncbi:MAG: MFS transporter [Trichloromonadaceae bacterium]